MVQLQIVGHWCFRFWKIKLAAALDLLTLGHVWTYSNGKPSILQRNTKLIISFSRCGNEKCEYWQCASWQYVILYRYSLGTTSARSKFGVMSIKFSSGKSRIIRPDMLLFFPFLLLSVPLVSSHQLLSYIIYLFPFIASSIFSFYFLDILLSLPPGVLTGSLWCCPSSCGCSPCQACWWS